MNIFKLIVNLLKTLATLTHITAQDNYYHLLTYLILTITVIYYSKTKNIMTLSQEDSIQIGFMIVKCIKTSYPNL
jgi:hypothetical protein